MGGDAFFVFFFFFGITHIKEQQREKNFFPLATQSFLFLRFFLLRLTLDFVQELLIETCFDTYVQDGLHIRNAHEFLFVCFGLVCFFNGSAV